MICYVIEYQIRGKYQQHNHQMCVDAVNLVSAKKKIGRKHGYKDGRMIVVKDIFIAGYC